MDVQEEQAMSVFAGEPVPQIKNIIKYGGRIKVNRHIFIKLTLLSNPCKKFLKFMLILSGYLTGSYKKYAIQLVISCAGEKIDRK